MSMTPFETLLNVLRHATVARIVKVVAKDENIIALDIDGVTTWDDDPDFEKTLRHTTRPWGDHEKTYKHYFGFADSARTSTEYYFQADGCTNRDPLGMGFPPYEFQKINPPKVDDWIAGAFKTNTKGPRLVFWAIVRPLAVTIREALLVSGGTGRVDDAIILQAENSDNVRDRELAVFARLIVNQDIGYYLERKAQGGNAYTADGMVKSVTERLRPELWERYKEESLRRRLYSSLIPEPAPKPIPSVKLPNDTRGTVGLNTPFARLTLRG